MCCFVYAGVGFGYDFSIHIGISLNYDVFETRADGIYIGHFNTSMYGGTVEYRFRAAHLFPETGVTTTAAPMRPLLFEMRSSR
jgi:hypothetical protein